MMDLLATVVVMFVLRQWHMIGLFEFLASVLWSWVMAELREEFWLFAIGVERMCGCSQQGLLELLVYVDQKCGFA